MSKTSRFLPALAALSLALAAPLAMAQTSMILPGPSGKAHVKFEITVPTSVRNEPLTGRVYVILSRDNKTDPHTQVARVGAPLFGHDVKQLAPGTPAVVSGMDLGTPVFDMADIPPGDYWVEPFVNVYSEFRRADGHVLWMHDDQWEGQNWARSPGNIYGKARKIHVDPASDATIKLVADQVIPPIVVPPDNEYVQRFKFKSPSLSKFWGRPIYLGATVLLPRDYKTSTISYPVNYVQGHFSLAAPYGFEAKPGTRNAEAGQAFHKAWLADKFPRMLVVTFQHPTPYFDDSYAVNSVNSGPYGDAVMQELIPEIEKRYRVIQQPWARWLSGGSTGGWESLALQIFHPDFFGGTWSYCPDSVTFTDVEGVDMYKDDNAFFKHYSEWQLTPTVNSREVNGAIRQTAQQRYWMELANGTHGRSGTGQQDVWQSTWGPIGEDGYFKPAVDSLTGRIDHDVTDYWREHYDLLHYLQRNWATVGPKLVDKIHVYVGNMDNFFLDRAVREMQAWMKTTQNPHYEGSFTYGDQMPHCWAGPGTTAERLKEMAEHGLRSMPAGTTTPWWDY